MRDSDWASGYPGLGAAGRETSAIWQDYHENSKLFAELARSQQASAGAVAANLHMATRSFRQYRGVPEVTLEPPQASLEPLQGILMRRRSNRDLFGAVSLSVLGSVLGQALGATAVVQNQANGVEQVLRAWPSAGGLYPIDAYVLLRSVNGVDPGLYHYNPLKHVLARLPARSVPDVLSDGFFWQEFVTNAAVVVLLVATFDRTIGKYGDRGYRLVLLDAGHVGQNLLLTAEQLQLNAVGIGGFNDDALALDLGIDGNFEAVVHSVAMGAAHAQAV
jgi:SagB-type dehydrogenase family enzyme